MFNCIPEVVPDLLKQPYHFAVVQTMKGEAALVFILSKQLNFISLVVFID